MSGIDSLWHWWDVCMRALVYLTSTEPDGTAPSPYWGLDIWMYRIDDLSWREREWRDSGWYKALYIEAGKGISSLRKNEGGDKQLTSSRVVTAAKCHCMFWDVLLGLRTLHCSIWQSFSKSPSLVCLCDGCCEISWECYNHGSLWCTTTLEEMGQKGIEGWWMIEEIFKCILSWRMASRMIFQVRLAGRWLRKTRGRHTKYATSLACAPQSLPGCVTWSNTRSHVP